MPNIEMKAAYHDLNQARSLAVQMGAKLLWKDTQTDTYFQTATGKLKLRESGLNGSELLPYIKENHENTNRSDYARIPISEPTLVKELLSKLLGLNLTVKKTREVYLLANVRIHLDSVEGLGNFLEFEAVFHDDSAAASDQEKRKVLELMRAFRVSRDDQIDVSYPDLLSLKTS